MTTMGITFMALLIGACAGFMGLLTWAELRTRQE
jgi:hypothetical protein